MRMLSETRAAETMTYHEDFWEREEFEDLVSRALIACYEEKLFTETPPRKGGSRWVLPPWRQGTMRDILTMRQVGPYIPPADREMVHGEYWYDLDGLPKYASLATKQEHGDSLDGVSGDAYIEIYLAEKVDSYPSRCVMEPGRSIAKYRVSCFYPKSSGGIEAYSQYIGITKSGRIIGEKDGAGAITGNATLQFYADRKHLWNVAAREKDARALFGVHEEQIKSLFYARSLPLSKTGRRRPILHWVKAHQRRIEAGVDIDIKKHLRGIEGFEMNGTLFSIESPVKTGKQ